MEFMLCWFCCGMSCFVILCNVLRVSCLHIVRFVHVLKLYVCVCAYVYVYLLLCMFVLMYCWIWNQSLPFSSIEK